MADYAAGSIYREVRRRRDLKIKEVKADLHQSTISHLEHDQSDMTLRTMMKILQPTFMSAEEFCHLIDDKRETATSIFKQIAHYYDSTDLTGLTQLLKSYKEKSQPTTPNRLIELMIQSFIDELSERESSLSKDDCDFVQDYLLQPGRWFSFEYISFANLVFSLPGKINLRIAKKMFHAYQQFHLPSYDELLVNALYNLSASFIDQDDPSSATRLLNFLDLEKLDRHVLYMRHHVTFLKLMIQFKLEPLNRENLNKLKVFLKATKLIDETLFEKNIDWLKSLKIDPDTILENA
ncbi:XRE family transcriptional regulator [Lacticaseibacillus casei]|uniref:XRE family transcriptional regulator n=1 Tax=Lacticaseibacillus huelsenbergensis TaxID=3035291 RepID=A0ABY8DSX7_9LACO|nr:MULTISPECIES: Rgg/GadR/MutR family transcriptional regulator [Lacticaseibacillus]MDG3061336.1 XRE family transcriptional regulator [Lacticaseibacillus sp. BCRC 81376]QVI38641.1 XRE family transcriptional regulator [Lacticaseibacillus casei]QXG60368.1 XRE family transcriptional regulator [Lacticaseibacillus casei]WFB38078.1 XRE family transcriptional regulator [Lacticaseibacillus huelsenbergensis]WFB42481.1 XRE family transcriptional regulator [Lacticaseibacillus huelsenbergensis]